MKNQCKALTKKGIRCKNKIAKGNRKYCTRHSKFSKTKLEKIPITNEQAQISFNKLHKRSQQLDISKKSKIMYIKPNKYWQRNIKTTDVESIDTPIVNTFGMMDMFAQVLDKIWVARINNKEKIPKDDLQSLVDNFHQGKSTDIRKVIRKITNKKFLLYLKKNTRKTHPHIRIEVTKRLKKLKSKGK